MYLYDYSHKLVRWEHRLRILEAYRVFVVHLCVVQVFYRRDE